MSARRPDPVRGILTRIRRAFLAVLGGVFILIGVPVAIATPFPFVPIGLPIIITGVVLLGRNSDRGRLWMEGILARWPKLERFVPDALMKLVFGRSKRQMQAEAVLREPPAEG
jgi:hypothetical protein